MIRNKLLALFLVGFLGVLSAGCIVSVEPETAVNPVGTQHTVTAYFGDEPEFDEPEFLCDLFDLLAPEYSQQCGSPGQAFNQVIEGPEIISFEIIDGPNQGLRSGDDCEPSCYGYEEPPEAISWTYTSNGRPGTDTIEVCSEALVEEYERLTDYLYIVFFEALVEENISEEEFLEAFVDVINDTFDKDYVSVRDIGCETARKTWVNERPNIGAGLSGLFQGQPTPLPTAAAPATTSPVIRPPNTGDAGLR